MKRFYSLLTVACLVVALCATGHAHITMRQFLATVGDSSVYLQWDKSCLLVISVNKADTTHYCADGITGGGDVVEILGYLDVDTIIIHNDTINDFAGAHLSVTDRVLNVTIPAQGDSALWAAIAVQVAADSAKWRIPEAAALTNLTTSNPLYKASAGVVACSTATATLRGVAKFSTDNFAVSSGDVTIKSGGTNSDEILDGTVTEVDLNVTNTPGAGEDGYSLTYNHAGTNMTWAEVLGGGGLWDTTANKDTVSLSGTADTTLKITRDGTNDTTKITAPAGTLVLGGEGLTKADSFGVANMLFSRDSISGVDVLNADTIVTDGDVIKDFTGPKLSVVAGVLTVTETDPVYIAGVAFNITASDTVGWNKGKDSGLVAWNWGSHASQGYLTSESDPVWTSDSVDYAMKSWVEALIEDSLNEYSLTTTIAATYEVLLNNEAGLYAVLSNVSNFVQDAEVPGLETDGVWTSDSGDYAMKTWVAAEINDSTEAYIHNRQWFNLKDYGGVGDSATNDSLAFHATLLGADSTGGIVFVPPGRFSVGTHTVGEGVWLLGIGVKSELLINGQLTVRGDTRISNLWVQPQLSSDSNAVVRFEPSAGTQYRCYADHIYGKWLQIVMSSTVGFEITDCQFRGSFDGSGGIAIYNESQGLIQGNIVDSAKNGIYINHSTQIQILDNVCRHGTQSGIAVAISGGYSQPDTGWNITIQDNHCYGNAHDGIDLNGDANWEYTDTLNMLVDHNFLHHNTHTGIYCAAGFVTISDNLIYQNVTQGIKVARSTGAANAYIAYGVVVSDNHLRNNNTGNGGSDHQILLENVGFAQVTDNLVYWTSGFTTGMEYGIWVQGIAANITGNYVWEHEGSARAANDPLIYAVITNTYTDLHDSMLVYGNRDHHESDTLYCNAPQHLTRSIVIDGTVDGVDVSELASDYATDSTKLDGIEAGADVTDAANVNPVETDQVWVSDSSHFVSEEDTNAFALTILLSADTAMGDSLDNYFDTATVVDTIESIMDSLAIEDFTTGDINLFGVVNEANFGHDINLDDVHADLADTMLVIAPFGPYWDTLGQPWVGDWGDSTNAVHPSKLHFAQGWWYYNDYLFYTPHHNHGGVEEVTYLQVSNNGIEYHFYIDSIKAHDTVGGTYGDTLPNPIVRCSDYVGAGDDTATHLSDVHGTVTHDKTMLVVTRVTFGSGGSQAHGLAGAWANDPLEWHDTLSSGEKIWLIDTTQGYMVISPSIHPDTGESYDMWAVERTHKSSLDSLIWIVHYDGIADGGVDTAQTTIVLHWEAPKYDSGWALVPNGNYAYLIDTFTTPEDTIKTISQGVVYWEITDSSFFQLWHLDVEPRGRDDMIGLGCMSPVATAGADSTELFISSSKDGGNSFLNTKSLLQPNYPADTTGNTDPQDRKIYRSCINWFDDGKGGYGELIYSAYGGMWHLFRTKVYFNPLFDTTDASFQAYVANNFVEQQTETLTVLVPAIDIWGAMYPRDSFTLTLGFFDTTTDQSWYCIDSCLSGADDTDRFMVVFPPLPERTISIDSLFFYYKSSNAAHTVMKIDSVALFGPSDTTNRIMADSNYWRSPTNRIGTSVALASYQVNNTDFRARDPVRLMVTVVGDGGEEMYLGMVYLICKQERILQ